MPLTPEIITRPAEPGEPLGRVVAQFPARGTLSTWDTVRIVIPKSTNGRIPDVVGLTVENARHRLARRDLAGFIGAYVDGKPGVVLAQYPRAGLAATKNLTIKLIVGRAS
jgi:beta-lactam-binding protein with PASTA domain